MVDRNAVKVGIASFFMLIILAGLLIWKSGVFYRLNGYEVVGEFSSVNGLVNGADVRYRGSTVGKVFEIEPTPKAVRVHFRVESGIKIPRNSVVKIYFDGLIGEKFLNIIPNAEVDEMIQDGDTLQGTVSAGLAEFVELGAQNLQETKELLNAYKDLLVQPEMLGSFKNIIVSVDKITRDLAVLSGALSGTNGRGSLPQIIDNLTQTTLVVRRNADLLLRDGEVAESSKAAIRNIYQMTEQLNLLLQVISKSVVTSDNVGKLTMTLDNAHSISSGLRDVFGSGLEYGSAGMSPRKGLSFGGEGEVVPVSQTTDLASYQGYVDTRIGTQFFRAGMAGSKGSQGPGLTAQFGTNFGPAATRVGFHNSQLAIGMDYHPISRAKVSVDVENIDHPELNARARYRFDNHLGLVVNAKKDLKSSESFNLGVGLSFSAGE